MSLVAEDVLLLLLDDGSGKPIVDSTKLPRVLAGGIVLELAMDGVVRVSGDEERVKKGRLVVTDAPAPTDPLPRRFAEAIASASRPMTPKKAIEKLQKGLTDEIAARLVDAGLLDAQQGKVLGLFSKKTWPARDSAHEDGVREVLRQVLVDGRAPDQRTAAIVSLLSAIDAVPKVVDGDKKELKGRAKDIAEGEWAGEAVRKAVQDVNNAIMVAVMVPTIVTTTSQ